MNHQEPRREIKERRLKRALLYQLSYAPTRKQGNTPISAEITAEHHNILNQLNPGCGISPVARQGGCA